MEAILETLDAGKNVVVEAVPGAGKSRLLVLACADAGGECLVLAYNAQLALSFAERLPAHATCVTFHALCNRCLATARDDTQLYEAVLRAERGELTPRDVPNVRRVLIDEAQDVRTLYLRLLRVLGLVGTPSVSVVVAGDRNQLIYDFDATFPATLDTLLATERLVAGEWHRARLTTSHRITRPMCRLVNAVFDTDIEAVRDGPPVEVVAPRSAFALWEALRDVVESEARLLVLTDRKRGNRPLRALLNQASRAGHSIAVHGIDDAATRARVECGTFWSAKGLEAEAVVVLLPAQAARNPCYVALSRATRRLVVVLDAREPHAAFCQAVLAHPDACAVRDDATWRVLSKGAGGDAARSLAPREWAPRTRLGRNVDVFHPPREAVLDACRFETLAAHAEEAQDGGEASATVMVRVALVAAEARRSGGRVRAFEDVLHPMRLDGEQAETAVRRGLVSRWVPPNVPDDALLAPDLRRRAERAYARLGVDATDVAAAADVALAILAWDDFDHLMRAAPRDPLRCTADRATIDWLAAALPGDVQYDLRLARDGCHGRVHASNGESCYHVVYERTSDDDAEAAIRASLHPQRRCRLVELRCHTIHEVTACTTGLLPESDPV